MVHATSQCSAATLCPTQQQPSLGNHGPRHLTTLYPPATAVNRVAKIFRRRLPAVIISNLHVAVENSSNPLQAASQCKLLLAPRLKSKLHIVGVGPTGYDMRGIHPPCAFLPSSRHLPCLVSQHVPCLCTPAPPCLLSLRTEVCFPRLMASTAATAS
ncbi:hypothetical protein C8F01DRAFT_1140627 [Mycena amicta]|nr:hypothetical protein C8F01DRAFT_1140627 [Mycena amicta]